jgi:DNA-binding transcriptional LysR family regulator
MISKGITLRGLELFAIAARSGSVAQTARAAGLSLAAVSQHLKNLEDAVGQPLLDHTRRPMQLTAAGRQFLTRIDPALAQIRQAETEAGTIDLSRITELRLGIIDDFDADLTPQFVAGLSRRLQGCGFRLATGLSHDLATMLGDGRLDIGILTSPEGGLPDLVEHPILRDPFVLALPEGLDIDGPDPFAALGALPLLRYDRAQMLGRTIEAILARRGLAPTRRFELSSNAALLAMVAAGAGWAVTTALSALRARQQGWGPRLVPLPPPAEARCISLFCADRRLMREAGDLAATFRRLLQIGVLGPARSEVPWLSDSLHLVQDRPGDPAIS